MKYFDIDKLIDLEHSKYFVVVGVAKRAREIYDNCLNFSARKEDLKPVSLAIDELLTNRCVLSVKRED